MDKKKMETLLYLIRQEPYLAERFLEIPQIQKDTTSFIINPECSCKGRLETYIENNESWALSLLESWKGENIKTNPLPKMEIKKSEYPVYTQGDVVRCGAVPRNYKKVIIDADNKNLKYRGVSTIHTLNEKGQKVYLNFFY